MAGTTKILLADWKGEAGSRRPSGAQSPERATIRASGAESADIPLSDREPAEGFHLTITSTAETICEGPIVHSLTCTDRSRASEVNSRSVL